MRARIQASWNGERPPYLRDRCEGYCRDGLRPSLHYHIPWAAHVGLSLIVLTSVLLVALVTCTLVGA